MRSTRPSSVLRAGLEHEDVAPRVRLGHRARGDRAHLEGRLHHPRRVPGPHPGRLRASPELPICCSTRTSESTSSRPGRLAEVVPPRRLGIGLPAISASLAYFDSFRRERVPATSSRVSATSSARTPTTASIGRASSTRSGRRTAQRHPAKDLHPERAGFLPPWPLPHPNRQKGCPAGSRHTRTSSCGRKAASVAPWADRMRDARLEVVDLDLQVHHHLLVARACLPHRARVALLGLEVQALAAVRRPQDHPAGFFRAGRPAKEAAVEVREHVGVGRVDGGPGHGQPGNGPSCRPP